MYIVEKMDQIVSLPSWVTFCLEYMNKYSPKKWVLWVFLYILIKLCHCLAGWLSAFTSLIMITGEQLTDGNVSTDINWTIELRWGPKVVVFIRNLRGKKWLKPSLCFPTNVTFPSETCIINSQLQMKISADNVQCKSKKQGFTFKNAHLQIYTVCYTFSTLKQFSTVCILQCIAIAKNRFSENWLLSLLTLNISRW